MKNIKINSSHSTAVHAPLRGLLSCCAFRGKKKRMLLDPHLVPSFLLTQQDVWLSPSSLSLLSGLAGWRIKFRIPSQESSRTVILIKIVSGTAECCRVILMSCAAALDSFAKSSSEMMTYGEKYPDSFECLIPLNVCLLRITLCLHS